MAQSWTRNVENSQFKGNNGCVINIEFSTCQSSHKCLSLWNVIKVCRAEGPLSLKVLVPKDWLEWWCFYYGAFRPNGAWATLVASCDYRQVESAWSWSKEYNLSPISVLLCSSFLVHLSLGVHLPKCVLNALLPATCQSSFSQMTQLTSELDQKRHLHTCLYPGLTVWYQLFPQRLIVFMPAFVSYFFICMRYPIKTQLEYSHDLTLPS